MTLTVQKVDPGDYAAIAPQLGMAGSIDTYAAIDLLGEPEKCTLHVAGKGGRIVAFLLLYQNALSVYRLAGDAEGAAELLGSLKPGPSIMTCPGHLGPVVRSIFPDVPSYLEHLMVVDRDLVHASGADHAQRLSPADAQALYGLYSSGEFASRTAFNSVDSYRKSLETQSIFGIRAGGEIVSVASAIAGNSYMGMVGSVFTALGHRGKGYGTAVTSAATMEVLRNAQRSMLYVRTDNAPAIKAYQKIGYREAEVWAFFDFGTNIVP